MKVKKRVFYEVEVTLQEIEDIKAAINWTINWTGTQPNSMPVEMINRLTDILASLREYE